MIDIILIFLYRVNPDELVYWNLLKLIRDMPAPVMSEKEFSKEFVDFINIWYFFYY